MDNTKQLTLNVAISVVILLAAITVVVLGFMNSSNIALSSIETGQEYNATTTFAGHTKDFRLLKTGQGSLGSVIVTGTNTGITTFYNATTTNVNFRTGNTPTSTILLADFPASNDEGTYTIDAVFTTGLLMVTSGAQATSTITWR